MYAASPARYSTLPYHRCGKSGLMLPAVSLGLWHNFGDTANFENMRLLCRTAFDNGITHFDLANNYGPYIRNFRENKAIPLRAKIISISLMWITMLYCVFFIVPYIWVKVILLIIAAGVTYHILSFKTLK